jgi:uncharacterized protein (DUF1778 family)
MHIEDLMATNSARIPVLVTKDEKARIVEAASTAGLSVGEFLRKAAAAYQPGAADDEKTLLLMIEQMNLATERAERSIDNTLAFVKASNERIDRMERAAADKVA